VPKQGIPESVAPLLSLDDLLPERRHWMALNHSSKYLPLDVLRPGFFYLIHARRGNIGIFYAADRFTRDPDRFLIFPEGGQTDESLLITEGYWSKWPYYGTAKPFVELDGPVAPAKEREALEAKRKEISYDEYVARTRIFY
jgi:hypothetical protein